MKPSQWEDRQETATHPSLKGVTKICWVRRDPTRCTSLGLGTQHLLHSGRCLPRISGEPRRWMHCHAAMPSTGNGTTKETNDTDETAGSPQWVLCRFVGCCRHHTLRNLIDGDHLLQANCECSLAREVATLENDESQVRPDFCGGSGTGLTPPDRCPTPEPAS